MLSNYGHLIIFECGMYVQLKLLGCVVLCNSKEYFRKLLYVYDLIEQGIYVRNNYLGICFTCPVAPFIAPPSHLKCIHQHRGGITLQL